MAVRAVIFDVDGTLVRKLPGSPFQPLAEGLRRAHSVLAVAGVPLPDLRTTFALVHRELSNASAGLVFGNYRESSIPALVRAFIGKAFPSAPPEAVETALRAWHAPTAESAVAAPGAAEALAGAAGLGLRIAAAGNSRWGSDFVRSELKRAGLDQWIGAIAYSADVGFRKPNLFVLKRALELLGVDGSEAVHVGDDPREDVEAPQELGMTAVVIAPAGSVPRADRTIASLEELQGILEELTGARARA